MTPTELRNLMANQLTLAEMKQICADLGEDIENIAAGASTKSAAALEIISFFQRRSRLQNLIDSIYTLRPDLKSGGQAASSASSGTTSSSKITILFLASDPTDQARLRLGQEFRDINNQLQMSRERDKFSLANPVLSVRALDFTGALHYNKPQIVHFSGHGSEEGELILESAMGNSSSASAATLSDLFEVFSTTVQCVVLNACYSKTQAKAIAKHIPYVIGMKKAIGDDAAIAFACGFYQALGAGMDVENAFKLGKVQIGLSGIEDENKTPILHKKAA